MFLSPYTLSVPRVERKIQAPTQVEREAECTLFSAYKPMPGGQEQFWDCVPFGSIEAIAFRWIWVRGGIGSGKSHLGSAFVCSRAFHDPESRGLITANSYSQLTTSTLISLVEFCRQFNIPIAPNRASVEDTARAIAFARMVQIFDARLLVLSAEAFVGATQNSKETGRGLQVRYVWADEYSYAPSTVFETINGRLGRGNGKIKGLGIITSSPNKNNPFNWAYETFVNPDRSSKLQKLFYSFNCLSSDNSSLDEDYVSSLEASYTPELAALELRGEFCIVAEGRICNYFNRDRHVVELDINPTVHLHISCDFNRSPCSSIIFQVAGDKIHILEEIHIPVGDTFALAKALLERLIDLSQELTPNEGFVTIHIHGDASGKNLTANSQQSNWNIIWSELKQLGETVDLKRRYKEANPSVINTINSLNSLLYRDRVLVSPRCKETIKDLEICRFEKRADGKPTIDKKSDSARSHWLDCVRYAAFDEFPIRLKSAQEHINSGSLDAETDLGDWSELFNGF